MRNRKTNLVKLSIITLGLSCLLAGCGGSGNKGNSDFTKGEMDEIDALFSDDERKELEAELGGGDFDSSSSKKNETYDETITIDPFEGVTAVISGTLPHDAFIEVKRPENDYSSEVYIEIVDGDKSSYLISADGLKAGDVVTVEALFAQDSYKRNLEKKLQKNVELSRTTAELEIIADPENYYSYVSRWDELTEEQQNKIISCAAENIEADVTERYSSLFDTEDHDISFFDTCDTFTISEPLGVFWFSTDDCVNSASVKFDVTDNSDYTRTVYIFTKNILVNNNTNEVEFTYLPKNPEYTFAINQGVTDIAEIGDSLPSNYPYYVDMEGYTPEYISLK